MKKILFLSAAILLTGAGCNATQQASIDTTAQMPAQQAPSQPTPPPSSAMMQGSATAGTNSAQPKGTVQADMNAEAKTNVGTKTNINAGLKITLKTVPISIKNYTYSQTSIRVNKGDKIVFTNNDAAPHTVTADAGAFASASLSNGQSYTLDTSPLAAGSYAFHCAVHPMMTGTVIVQ